MRRDIPVLMTADMYNASAKGLKTNTRRVILPQPAWETGKNISIKLVDDLWRLYCGDQICKTPFWKPKYRVGDRLWVKEPFKVDRNIAETGELGITYTRDNWTDLVEVTQAEWNKFMKWDYPYRGKSSLYMFKSLTRLWLEITEVRVERLQDISTASIKAEGIKLSRDEIEKRLAPNFGVTSEVGVYRGEWIELWDSINKGRGYGWDVNPWVWVVEFKKVAV